MLKLKLATIEGLPADVAKEYKKEGDFYVLDTDVKFEDVTPLKNALVQEKLHRKEATEKVTALETTVADLTARAGTASDIEKSWGKKLADADTAAKEKQTALTKQLQTLLVDNVAQQLAVDISTAPNLLLPHIKSRLVVAEEDGKMITRVLDGDGKASALSVNELKAEIVADKQFAPIITASKASGGGAQGGKGTPGGAKEFKDMTEGDKTALFQSDPARFRSLAAEHAAKPKTAPAPAAA